MASESTLERDWLILLDFDFDGSIERYEEQPLRIDYRDEEGRRRHYFPDVLIFYKDNRPPLLCEVKYRDELKQKWKEMKPKIRAALAYARERGWRFRILTEREIRTPFLTNVKFLRHQRRFEPSDDLQRMVIDKLRRMRRATPERLVRAIHHDPRERAEIIPIVWYLLSTRQVYADLTQPLTMDTLIKLIPI